MPEEEIDTLKAGADLGLSEPDIDRVSATVSAALDREYQREGGRGEGSQTPGGWRRRSRYVIATVAALVIGGAATVGYAALNESSTASDGIGCYSGDEIGGSVTIVGLDGRKATDTCADLWAAGEVVGARNRAPAPLHACVSTDGGGPISVLASFDAAICEQSGLAEDPDAGSDPDARRFGEFESEVMTILERGDFACVGPERMRGLLERGLSTHRLRGWTIGVEGSFDQVNRCATLAFDSDARTVTMFAGRP